MDINLQDLPLEIIVQIIKNLPLLTIAKLSLVSTFFNMVCQEETLWKYLLFRDYNKESKDGNPKVTYQKCLEDSKRCKHIFLKGSNRGIRCSNKPIEGSDRCRMCVGKLRPKKLF